MLFLPVLFVVFLSTEALDQEYLQKVKDRAEKIVETCSAEEQASADDILELIELKFPPTSHEAKCVLACFYKHYHIMTDAGTWDIQAAISAFDPVKAQDADLHAKLMKVIDTCGAEPKIVDDHCETASLMATCFMTESQAAGISKDSLMANA